MAKPKVPKTSNGAKESVSTTNTPPPVMDSTPATEQTASAVLSATDAEGKIDMKTETRKTGSRKTVRKPEIVKTDSRATLVPINLEDEIRRLAYLLSERRGFEPGHESEDWLTAETEVLQRYRQHSA